ncbi:MAG: hypothetical protein JJ992_00015, partial [Planctomycetes bacterium]|nr:hypothetical protein [Planctomycetota bacterium]
SAHFRVPAGVPFFLQVLDEEGKAVQTMRSATYVQAGQTFTCIGCHEPRNSAPRAQPSQAFARPPSTLLPGPSGSWPLDFQSLVGPVLAHHCVHCHRPEGDAAEFDLNDDKAYDALVNYGQPSLRQHVMARYQQGRSTANAGAAQESPLVALLRNGHYNVRLQRDDWNRLFTWMDTYGQRLGSFGPDQEEQLRNLRLRLSQLLSEQRAEQTAPGRPTLYENQ